MRPQVSNRVVQPASNFLHLFDQTVPGRLSGHNAHNRFQANFPATELLQNLRENIAQVLREQPLPSGADEAPSAEFNYALNKVVWLDISLYYIDLNETFFGRFCFNYSLICV